MKLVVGTSRIGYKGKDRLDITVGSGWGWGRVFAPSWDLVWGYKSGKLSFQEYEKGYLEKMRRVWVEDRWAFRNLFKMGKVTLVCYCRSDEHCHRRLLREIVVKIGRKYSIEIVDLGELGGSPPAPEFSMRFKKLGGLKMKLGFNPKEAKWGEYGGWYVDNIAVSTAVGQQISGLRRDEKCIAITGHRDIGKRTVDAAKWWIGVIARKYPEATIITGGALGTDMLVATLSIKAGLNSKVYLPFEFETHTSRWNATSKASLKWVLERSEVVVVGGSEYSVRLYFRRNERMVDNADLVLAFWDGREDGGTVGCIKYAQHKHKQVFDAFDRGELETLPGENIYDKYDVHDGNANDTIDYFDDATYISSAFQIDWERHGDGVDGTLAKANELAEMASGKLDMFLSADYQVHNGVVFERHEDRSWRDTDSIACRIKMGNGNHSAEEVRKVAGWLEIVDKERRLEDQWMKWLRKDWDRTVAYLEKLYNELVNFEPDVEIEALLEWANDPEAEAHKPTFVQAWNDDPSEDNWDELGEDGVAMDATYGWHRLNDPNWKETPAPKIEDVLSKVALPIYHHIQGLEGNALAGYGRVLYRLWAEWKDGKRNGMKQRDWDELWGAYNFRKSNGLGLRT